MQIVDPKTLVTAVPLEDKPKKMTREEKLNHWAQIVREYPYRLQLVHLLERWAPHILIGTRELDTFGTTALHLAGYDPVLKEQGLKSRAPADIMGFFEITQNELHEFSCDCGGEIDNEEQARRIEGLPTSYGVKEEPPKQRTKFLGLF